MSETISPNLTIAQYSIISMIGAGGMGEVYRARDTRLDREVAIKILPADFAMHADRMNRFEQEARATSSLNHPNILTVYDIGTHNGSPYIVAELLEGEELRDRLDQGQIPLRKAIDYAQQIVSGLSAAHEKGIVHRDLKPENLFITTAERVKILDFGLAKLSTSSRPTSVDISEDATRKVLTNPGVVMGTVGYMSPEQVRGEKTDHRSDIFSFGAILHEMITGRRAFRRDTMAETMTAILREEPEDLTLSNPSINPALERIVCRCLEKKPERRFQSTADLGFALEALSAPTSSSGGNLASAAQVAVVETKRKATFRLLPWIIAVACLITLAATLPFAVQYFRQARAAQSVPASFFIAPPDKSTGLNQFAISPDGRNIVFVATVEGKAQLWLRPVNSFTARPISGTEGANGFPFWSPDGRTIIFQTISKARRVDLAEGTVQTLWEYPNDIRGFDGTWNREGTVLAFNGGNGIFRLSPTAGGATLLPGYEPSPDRMLRWPKFLPDGRHFLFLWTDLRQAKSDVYVGSIDSAEQKRIVSAEAAAIFAPSPEGGRLLFVRDGALLAQQFDTKTFEVSGEPVRISEHIRVNVNNRAYVSASDNGILVFDPTAETEFRVLTWFDRDGKQIETVGQPGINLRMSLSVDQKYASVTRRDETRFLNDLFVLDITRGASSRLDSGAMDTTEAVWSPDGSRLVWSYRQGSVYQLKAKLASGAGQEELLFQSDHPIVPTSWSSDGRFIFFSVSDPKTLSDIWVLPLEGDRKPFVFFQSPANDSQAVISPDGKFVAYRSTESGADEIYVQTFPASASKWPISIKGGLNPRWRRDGKELFYYGGDGKLMSVEIKTDGGFQPGIPKPLFDVAGARAIPGSDYAVSPDGQRFLFLSRLSAGPPAPLAVMLNWTADLKK